MSQEIESPTHDPIPMKLIWNLFLVPCQGRHLIGRLECRHVILNLAGTADHAKQATWRANFVLLPSTRQKISTWKNFARAAADEQNGPGLRESSEKAVPTRRKLLIVVFATSAYKLPTTSSKSYYCKRQLSLPATSTQTRELWYRRLDPNVDT